MHKATVYTKHEVEILDFFKKKPFRSPRLLALAEGQHCLLRIGDLCNGDPATTVAAHSNQATHGKGRALKAHDAYSVQACRACHTWLDQGPAPYEEKMAAFERAHVRQVYAWQQRVKDKSLMPIDRREIGDALKFLENQK